MMQHLPHGEDWVGALAPALVACGFADLRFSRAISARSSVSRTVPSPRVANLHGFAIGHVARAIFEPASGTAGRIVRVAAAPCTLGEAMNERELLEVVGDVLAGSGFSRRGKALRRVGSEVASLVGLQKDRWSELRYLEIGLNLSDPQRRSSVAPLRMSDVAVRLESLVPPVVRVEVIDVFDLGKELADGERRARLASLTETVVRPWLDKATTIVGVGHMVRDGLLPEAFLPLVARRCLAKHCVWISAEP